jgi:hypothetical protein
MNDKLTYVFSRAVLFQGKIYKQGECVTVEAGVNVPFAELKVDTKTPDAAAESAVRSSADVAPQPTSATSKQKRGTKA